MQIDRIASRFSHVEKKVDEYAAKRLPGCRRNAFTTVIWFVVAAVGVLGNVNHVARAELPDGALHEIRFSPANRGLGGVKPGGGLALRLGLLTSRVWVTNQLKSSSDRSLPRGEICV